jgi:hypothetical protein
MGKIKGAELTKGEQTPESCTGTIEIRKIDKLKRIIRWIKDHQNGGVRLVFSPELSSYHRRFIHESARKASCKSKSFGRGETRRVHLITASDAIPRSSLMTCALDEGESEGLVASEASQTGQTGQGAADSGLFSLYSSALSMLSAMFPWNTVDESVGSVDRCVDSSWSNMTEPASMALPMSQLEYAINIDFDSDPRLKELSAMALLHMVQELRGIETAEGIPRGKKDDKQKGKNDKQKEGAPSDQDHLQQILHPNQHVALLDQERLQQLLDPTQHVVPTLEELEELVKAVIAGGGGGGIDHTIPLSPLDLQKLLTTELERGMEARHMQAEALALSLDQGNRQYNHHQQQHHQGEYTWAIGAGSGEVLAAERVGEKVYGQSEVYGQSGDNRLFATTATVPASVADTADILLDIASALSMHQTAAAVHIQHSTSTDLSERTHAENRRHQQQPPQQPSFTPPENGGVGGEHKYGAGAAADAVKELEKGGQVRSVLGVRQGYALKADVEKVRGAWIPCSDDGDSDTNSTMGWRIGKKNISTPSHGGWTQPGSIPRMRKGALALLPQLQFPGRVIISETEAEVEAALNYLDSHRHNDGIFGFDTETKPTFKKGERGNRTGLVQISTATTCVLVRLNQMDGYADGQFPSVLLDWMLDSDRTFCGVGIHADFKAINREFKLGFKDASAVDSFVPGAVELSLLAKQLKCSQIGLAALCGSFLGMKMSKAQQISNWGANTLTPPQIVYASTDAWAGRQIYLEMLKRI